MGLRLVGMVALALVVFGLGSPGIAPRALAATDAYDLAAMTLVPGDVGEPGFGFHSNADQTRDEYAAAINRIQQGDEDAEDVVAEALDEAGWLRTYASQIGAVQDGRPDLFRKVIFVRLTQYADAEGATAGFALLDEAFGAPGFQAVANAPTYGDRSALVRFQTRQGGANQRYDELDLALQSDDLVIELYVWDYSGDAPAVSALTPLVDALLPNIAGVRDGAAPGLSLRVLRLDDDGVIDYFDFYRERDREVFPFFDEPAEAVSAERQAFTRARITDMYFVAQTIPSGTEPSDPVYNYRVTLYRFESAVTARNWLTSYPRDFVTDPPAGFEDVEAVDDAARFGERSIILSHRHVGGDDTLRGFTAYLLSVDVVAIVALEGPPGVTLDAIEALAEGQADCLADEGCLDGAPIPDDLEDVR